MLAPFVAFLDQIGATANRVLDANNLSRELVDRGRGKVTKFQFYQFLADGGPGLGLPDFGYRIGQSCGMRFMGPVGKSVLRAATLNDAVDTFALHLRHWLDGNQLWLEPDAESTHAWLCNLASDGLHGLQAISNQCALMTLVSLVREAAGESWTPDKIRLDPRSAAVSRAAITALVDSEVEIIPQGVAIRIPAKLLSQSVSDTSRKNLGEEADLPPASPEGFAGSFEKTLCDQLPFLGVPTIHQAAEITGVSPRTLQRQLGVDGLTYQRLIDRIRFQVARERLREDPYLTTHELAGELCYASPSSFVRSFRRIAGVTPGQFARERI